MAPYRAHSNLGVVPLQMGDPVAAGTWMNLGIALEATGDRGAAAEAYRRALALDPGNERARERLARIP